MHLCNSIVIMNCSLMLAMSTDWNTMEPTVLFLHTAIDQKLDSGKAWE